MTLIPQVRPAVKAEPRYLVLPFADGTIGFTICAGRRTDHYFIERIDCDDLAYQLIKMDVNLDGTDKEADGYCVNLTQQTCECRGFLRWNKPCKHIDAVVAAYAEGRLQ